MSYTYAEDYRGGTYVVEDEGTAESPIDFHTLFENLKGVKSGLFQTPRNYGAGTLANPYELCEGNASEWSSSGDVGSPADEAVDFKYNSYAIKCIKTGSGSFGMTWNENGTYQNWDTPSVSWFAMTCTRLFKFSIKPSVQMTLDQINIYAGGTTATYFNSHTNDGAGWTLTAGVWNDFEIDPADFDTPVARFLAPITKVGFSFSGGATSDTILIDGLRCEKEDCDAVKHGKYIYEYGFRIAIVDCYFKHDTQATIFFNCGGCFYGGGQQFIDVESYQFDIGSTDDKFPLVFLYDVIESGDRCFSLAADSADHYIYNCQFIDLNWQWDRGVLATGGSVTFDGTSPYKIRVESCYFNIATINTYEGLEMVDCDLICESRPLYSTHLTATAAPALLEGIRVFYKPSVYIWMDEGTMKGVQLFGWTETDNSYNTFFYQRSFRSADSHVSRLIDFVTDGVDIDKLRITQYKYWNDDAQRLSDQIIEWGFTMNLVVKNEEGPIQGATVELRDKDNNLVFSVTTNQDGEIPEQEVITMENNFQPAGSGGGSGGNNLEPWDDNELPFDTVYQPFKFTITYEGYQQYIDDSFELNEPFRRTHINLQPILYSERVSPNVELEHTDPTTIAVIETETQ